MLISFVTMESNTSCSPLFISLNNCNFIFSITLCISSAISIALGVRVIDLYLLSDFILFVSIIPFSSIRQRILLTVGCASPKFASISFWHISLLVLCLKYPITVAWVYVISYSASSLFKIRSIAVFRIFKLISSTFILFYVACNIF